ncbi:MAG TPA: sugar phosphate isomerase/epimerase, partial [Phycisphaerae bacterium]|nr:sugar phosphate isomerase/epimerase [Phycisphaerae bacterium]
MKYGLQVYTVRDNIAADFEGAFSAIKNIGYEYVELPGLFGKKPSEIKELMERLSLKVASMMILPAELESMLDDIISACKTLDCNFVVCSFVPEEFRTVEGYTRLAGILESAAVKFKSSGITLAHHNHAFEFDALPDGRCGYDILFEGTATLCFEPDVYWLAFAGRQPLAMMRKLAGRMPLLHLKDMSSDSSRSFCEVGQGILPMREIILTSEAMDVEYAFVEQDGNWAASPMDSA